MGQGCGRAVPDIVHARCLLEAGDIAVHVYRPSVIDICDRHGFDPNQVAWIRHDVIDAPLLQFGLYLLDVDGRVYLEDGDKLAMREVDVALRGELPAWWQPLREAS
jgi:hypothetical protein